ncbi:polyribonucleotide nucleotidyltransferase, partial [Candidatus Babeliales bacterium]|nr:polyribonucleotide nucleotidyltransferase [Candidatus Babeliales bacterium]
VLSTAVASKEMRDFMGFFPLTVEYRERPSSAGRIPGGFFKREGKLSDTEVLVSRLIDRPMRPLFPSYYFNDVQLISNVHSADGGFPTSVLATIGSSLALTISDIPFMGPVGAVQVGRVDGEWKFNLSYEEIKKSDAHFMVSGTKDGICMVEGNCDTVQEDVIIDLISKSHKLIIEQVEWQLSIQREVGKPKKSYDSNFDWDSWKEKVRSALPEDFADSFYNDSKLDRSSTMATLKEGLITKFKSEIEAGEVTKVKLNFVFDLFLKDTMPQIIAQRQKRFDGRTLSEVRAIESSVKVLPCTHGSAVFQRGETQALASLTLGTGQDAQKIETLMGGLEEQPFMLHYNFPPFATGEVRPIRGVGRREIGHGHLARNSFKYVLPSQEDFPYTIRSVVDILESNGSSSMATVCATTLAMMDGGVPLKDIVSGIAMGLLKDSEGKFHVLTDLTGVEDAYGLMDLKITGTKNGVCAIQMDIKEKNGLTVEVLRCAFEQAKEGRMHILERMKETLMKPRETTSATAPQVVFIKIPIDKIGLVIGPSGKNIKEIIAKTEAQIDIEDSGTVKIYAKNQESAEAAAGIIKAMVGDVEVGTEYNGIIRRYTDFGIFVEIVPGRDGLIHISTIAKELQNDINKTHPVNAHLKVKVIAYDSDSGRIRLVSPELEKKKV